MARVKVPSGTVQKFEKVFDDLQTNIKSNVKKQFETILNDTFGNVLSVVNGTVSDSDLKVSVSSTTEDPLQLTVQSGSVLTRSGDVIKVTAPFTTTQTLATANTFILIKIAYKEVGGDSTTAMNSFLYDSTGSSAYSTKYTRYTDSFALSFSVVTEASGWRSALGENEVPLALSKMTGSGTFTTGAWTFTDAIEGKTYSVAANTTTIADLRGEYRAVLDHDLLDDSKVIFKDRSSVTGNGGGIQGSLEISQDLTIGDDLTVVDNILGGGKIEISQNEDQKLIVGLGGPGITSGAGGVPLQVSNSVTAQSKAGGGNGHIAHFWGDTKMVKIVEQDTDSFSIYTGNALENAGYLRLGRTDSGDDESIQIHPTRGTVSIGRNRYSTNENHFHVNHVIDTLERLALDRSLVIKHSNNDTFGINWRMPNSGKVSAKIIPIDTADDQRTGLGIFTQDNQNQIVQPFQRIGIGRTGKVVIGATNDFSSFNEFFRVEGNTKVIGSLESTTSATVGTDLSVAGITTLSGDVDVEGTLYSKGGLNVTGPYIVSGLTNRGTLFTEGNNSSANLLNLTFREEKDTGDIIHDKGAIHLDGFLNATLSLNDQNGARWVDVTPLALMYSLNQISLERL